MVTNNGVIATADICVVDYRVQRAINGVQKIKCLETLRCCGFISGFHSKFMGCERIVGASATGHYLESEAESTHGLRK